MSIIRNHIASAKHVNGKEKIARNDRSISKSLAHFDIDFHPKGEELPERQRIYRVKVLNAFLRAGVPLNKLSCFADVLEDNAYSLGGRRTLSDLIPFVLQNEKVTIRKEVTGKAVSVIFDGTARLGEALCIILRYVDEWMVQQRLVRFLLLAHSMKGEEIAREILTVILSSVLLLIIY